MAKWSARDEPPVVDPMSIRCDRHNAVDVTGGSSRANRKIEALVHTHNRYPRDSGQVDPSARPRGASLARAAGPVLTRQRREIVCGGEVSALLPAPALE